MKVNDVLRKDKSVLRVLAIRGEDCLCIDCNAPRMPFWASVSELKTYTQEEAQSANTALSASQKQVAHERFTMIAPILAFLTDDAERNRVLGRVSDEYSVSKQTLRRWLCKYLAVQDISALAPAERETEQELTLDQKNMRWALNKYFYTPKKSKLTDVYVKLLKEKYCDAEGKLPAEYPSMRQFRYFE